MEYTKYAAVGHFKCHHSVFDGLDIHDLGGFGRFGFLSIRDFDFSVVDLIGDVLYLGCCDSVLFALTFISQCLCL